MKSFSSWTREVAKANKSDRTTFREGDDVPDWALSFKENILSAKFGAAVDVEIINGVIHFYPQYELKLNECIIRIHNDPEKTSIFFDRSYFLKRPCIVHDNPKQLIMPTLSDNMDIALR
jgi:hypothetical protein